MKFREPTLYTDAAPPMGDDTPIVFLAGAIKYWWLHKCPSCDRLYDSPQVCACEDEHPEHTVEIWGTWHHVQYVQWREKVREALINAGCLTYAPHEAFKGRWTERAQAVNDAGIMLCNVMLVLSPYGIPTDGTDNEVVVAKALGKTILYAPPYFAADQSITALLYVIKQATTNNYGIKNFGSYHLSASDVPCDCARGDKTPLNCWTCTTTLGD